MADHQDPDQDAAFPELYDRESDQSIDPNLFLIPPLRSNEEISGAETNQTHHQDVESQESGGGGGGGDVQVEENRDVDADAESLNARIESVNDLNKKNNADMEALLARFRTLTANLRVNSAGLDGTQAQIQELRDGYNRLDEELNEAAEDGIIHVNPHFFEGESSGAANADLVAVDEEGNNNDNLDQDVDGGGNNNENLDQDVDEGGPEIMIPNPWPNVPWIRPIRIVNNINGLIQDMTVEVDLNQTVLRLKQEIQAQTGFAVENQDLNSFDESTMVDDMRVSYYIHQVEIDDFFVQLTVNPIDEMVGYLLRLQELGIINLPIPVRVIRLYALFSFSLIVRLSGLQLQ